MRKKPRFIDLFAGCGGLSEGFRMAGWKPVYAVEKDKAAAASYAANFKCDVWVGLIEDFVRDLEEERIVIPKVDAVIGGPPCQGFSPLGKMSAKPGTKINHASMNELWEYFLRVVKILNPPLFVTENVPEFIRSHQFENYQQKARSLGYSLSCGVLKAEEFGVPQKRRRTFCIGSRMGTPSLPAPNGKRGTVSDAIRHLSLEPDGVNLHIGRNPTEKSLERYKVIPPGGNRFDLMRERPDLTPPCWMKKKTGTTDVFGRLRWEEQAPTIRTEFFKPEKGRYLHPEAHRPITHREAACLQTFRENFIFVGSKIEIARQIGEAVPPQLASEIAKKALAILEGEH